MWLNLTRAEAERRFAEWVVSEPERRQQLHAWVQRTGGPSLEPTLESLRPLNRWYLDRAVEAQEDPSPGRPPWAWEDNPDFVPVPGGPRAPSDALMRLWDLIAVHVGDAIRAQVPGAEWVCYRNGDRRDDRNGKPMMDIGWPTNPADVISLSNGGTPGVVCYGQAFDPDHLHDRVVIALEQLANYRARQR